MAKNSGIEYVQASWNPWHGCHKIRPEDGCKNCYMFKDKKRFGQDPEEVVRSSNKTFYAPLKWKDPRRIFVCSWSDFFICEADYWRPEAIDVMLRTPQHTYIIITKRYDRMTLWSQSCIDGPDVYLPENVIWGITAENHKWLEKGIKYLLQMPGKKLLSIEPMLGCVDLNHPYDYWGLPGEEKILRKPYWAFIDCIIFGAESGPSRRPCDIEWIRNCVQQCEELNIPVFVKQIHINGKLSKNMDEWPEDLRVREWPE